MAQCWASLDSLNNIERQQEYDIYSLEESEAIWMSLKEENTNHYVFLVKDGGSIESISIDTYRFFEIRDGRLFSRKYISETNHVNGVKWSCIPNFEQCPVKLKIDILRTVDVDNTGYRNLLKEHFANHTMPEQERDRFECWEDFNQYATWDRLNQLYFSTIDEIYLYLKDKKSKGAEIRILTNKDGIISSAYINDQPRVILADYSNEKVFQIINLSFK